MTTPSDSELARYRRVRRVFDEVGDLPAGERSARLDELRRTEPEVAEDVAELLAIGDPRSARLLDEGLTAVPLLEDETREIPKTVGRYQIRGVLGSGGMGSVYDAWDPQLERTVALKILPPEVAASGDRLDRFEREAKALAALRHPGVVTVYSVEHETGRHFFTMERISGETLASLLPTDGLPLEVFTRWSRELAAALACAHDAGIVHRDLKPANVMVEDGTERIRLVDFGLVKRTSTDESARATGATASGMIMGTWRYMSPEQARGEPAGAQSDVFSLGVVLYEMLTGASPFERSSAAEVAAATLHESHPPVEAARPDVPRRVAAVVDRCLAKDPAQRFADAGAVADALDHALASPASRTKRRRLGGAAAVVGLAVLALASFGWFRNDQDQRAAHLSEEVAAVEALQAERRQWEAFLAARDLAAREPQDPRVQRLLDELTVVTDIRSEPPGVRVRVRSYEELDGEWIDLGTTPIEQRAVPNDVLVLRAEMESRRPLERQYEPRRGPVELELVHEGDVPEGMIPIQAGTAMLDQLKEVSVPEFWMKRTEVTNAEYLRFVEAGGYDRAGLWPRPIVVDGEVRSFARAKSVFVDRSGRPGPSTWSAGTYPEGAAEQPVVGVSWYEASAYARWAGRSLPSIHHWQLAAPRRPSDHMARRANFNSDGPRAVGSSGAVSATGAHDLAGNAAEWVANAGTGGRYVLGSSWRDPRYSYGQPVVRDPASRGDTLGFRTAELPVATDPSLFEPLVVEPRDFSTVEPVSDEVFDAFRQAFATDPAPLDDRIERVDESSPYWIRETVSFAASYGDERVLGRLFLPRRANVPHQTVVYFPSASAFAFSSSEQLADLPIVDFLPRSGRAFFVPVYKGLYERRERIRGPEDRRQRIIEIVQDLRRAVDYVESRADLDADRLAYVSLSLGSNYGPIFLALEPRFDAAVWIAGGFADELGRTAPPMVHPWNFASRVTTPVLMINGRGDQFVPVQTAQKPLFEMLAAPPEDKRHVVLEGGSLPDDQNAIARETLDWLDHYLGPVDFGAREER